MNAAAYELRQIRLMLLERKIERTPQQVHGAVLKHAVKNQIPFVYAAREIFGWVQGDPKDTFPSIFGEVKEARTA